MGFLPRIEPHDCRLPVSGTISELKTDRKQKKSIAIFKKKQRRHGDIDMHLKEKIKEKNTVFGNNEVLRVMSIIRVVYNMSHSP